MKPSSDIVICASTGPIAEVISSSFQLSPTRTPPGHSSSHHDCGRLRRDHLGRVPALLGADLGVLRSGNVSVVELPRLGAWPEPEGDEPPRLAHEALITLRVDRGRLWDWTWFKQSLDEEAGGEDLLARCLQRRQP